MPEQDDKGHPAAPSFNPKTWLDTPAAAEPMSQPVPGPDPPADEAQNPPRPPALTSQVRAGLLAGLGVLLLLGIATFWMTRPRHAPTPPPAATATMGAVRVLTAESVERVGPALAASGLDAATVGAVDQAMATAPFERADRLRLDLTTRAEGAATRLQVLEVRDAAGAGVRLTASGAGFTVAPLSATRTLQVHVARGEMGQDTFYASAVGAGVPDLLITPFAQAFAFDFDFQREIAPGDQFEAAYEEAVGGSGERQGRPRLIYVALTTRAKSRAFYRFTPRSGAEESWFDASGSGTARGLMRTPVEGARISSPFGPRFHPIKKYMLTHKGIDFSVPTGTTVFASGAGVVEFVGVHGGHGNYIAIRHSDHLTTAYAHLSVYDVARGEIVRQGEPIAQSGNTGASTGPHLHYEVIVDGTEVDPLTFTTAQAQRLTGPDLAAFLKEKERIDRVRDAAL